MSLKHILFSRRNILGILLGVVASFILITLMKNYLLASVLGMMITLIVLHLRQPREMTILGLVTGSIAGLYCGARNYLSSGNIPMSFTDAGLIISMLGGLVWTALVCAGYAFLLGRFFQLYTKGERPFF